MPFTGDSSDDSSDGEDHAVMMGCITSTHNSHNSSSTDNTETSTSGSASSPSKSLKTSSSLSPAKNRSGSESPKTKIRGMFFRDWIFHCRIIEHTFHSTYTTDTLTCITAAQTFHKIIFLQFCSYSWCWFVYPYWFWFNFFSLE